LGLLVLLQSSWTVSRSGHFVPSRTHCTG
jgi:hypothetical protein